MTLCRICQVEMTVLPKRSAVIISQCPKCGRKKWEHDLADPNCGPVITEVRAAVLTDKQKRKRAECNTAQMILARLGIKRGTDFHTIERSKVAELLIESVAARYRHPKDANGSRALYFHERLQRQANYSEES